MAKPQRESKPVADAKAKPSHPATEPAIAPVQTPIVAGEPEVTTKMVSEFPIIPPRRTPPPSTPPKVSRRTPEGQTRLHMSVGTENGVTRDDIVRVIQGETGLPESTIGHVDLRERHTFLDVASQHAQAIVSKLKRAQLADRRLKVKLATPQPEEP